MFPVIVDVDADAQPLTRFCPRGKTHGTPFDLRDVEVRTLLFPRRRRKCATIAAFARGVL
jgi:hypothetical protein